jgi:parallel beta-helix repeat protein
MKKPKTIILIFLLFIVIFCCRDQMDENQTPVAVISASPSSGIAPLSVSFNGSASSDPDGDTLEYDWNFGDGSNYSGIQAVHVYSNVGEYTATLTVNDGRGGISTASTVITVQDEIPTERTFYVSPTGNDQNPGNENLPWKTFQHAADLVDPGDVIIIMPGTYGKGMKLSKSGTADLPIKFKGNDVSKVIIDASADNERDCVFMENCQYIFLENITIQNAGRAGLRLSYSHHITIKNCRLLNNTKWGIFTDFSDYTTIQDCEASGSREEHGIYISNSSDFALIKRNRCGNNAASGIQINADPSMGGDGISSGCTIDSNLCYENGSLGGSAINLASMRDSVISNNVVYNNYAGGIAAWDDGQGDSWGSKNLQIINNTIYFRPGQGRWCISLKNGTVNGTIKNNLLFGGARGSIELDDTTFSSITSDYNILFSSDNDSVVENEDTGVSYAFDDWKNNGQDVHSALYSPLQVINGITDFNPHLITTSPAIDKGTTVNLSEDYEGDPRPLKNGYDIGADEAN